MVQAAVLPLIAAAGQVVQGIGGYAAGRKNKRILNEQARQEINNGAVEAERLRTSAREAMAAQVAAQFGNGMFGGTGSALDALAESQINAAVDALAIKRDAESRARSLRQQGKQAAAQGRDALTGSLFNAATDWTSARRGTTSLPSGRQPSSSTPVAPGTRGPV